MQHKKATTEKPDPCGNALKMNLVFLILDPETMLGMCDSDTFLKIKSGLLTTYSEYRNYNPLK
ncbi:hypothetical protein HNQ90_001066 [Algibacter amylolyticus]|nr:hypothetical protein [Algibacter amylolyticus]